MNEFDNAWREDWLLKSGSRALSWEELSRRQSESGMIEQEFWRGLPDRAGGYSDRDLESATILRKLGGKTYHIAHIPWRIGKKKGKEFWTDEDWVLLGRLIDTLCSNNRHLLSAISWERLTLKAHSADHFLRYGLRDCHIIGDIDVASMGDVDGKGSLFDGDLSGSVSELKNATVAGTVSSGRSLSILNSRVASVFFDSGGSDYPLFVQDSVVGKLAVQSGASLLSIRNSSVEDAQLNKVKLGKLLLQSENNDEICLSMADSQVLGRAHIEGVKVSTGSAEPQEDRIVALEHTHFEKSLRVVNANLKLSIFCNTKMNAQVDIDFIGQNIEDVFELELSEVRAHSKRDLVSGEELRKRLERACQIICERHRQDGRKDLEHRFRRMELKARAYRADADKTTRSITWCYAFFSDFGRSVSRPLRGLSLITLLFFVLYIGFGAASLDLSFFPRGPIEPTVLRDAALLATDKIFPFGASIDETKLFGGEVIGAGGGIWGAALGLLGAVQTVLCGIMLFLVGLAVRTKLLIG